MALEPHSNLDCYTLLGVKHSFHDLITLAECGRYQSALHWQKQVGDEPGATSLKLSLTTHCSAACSSKQSRLPSPPIVSYVLRLLAPCQLRALQRQSPTGSCTARKTAELHSAHLRATANPSMHATQPYWPTSGAATCVRPSPASDAAATTSMSRRAAGQHFPGSSDSAASALHPQPGSVKTFAALPSICRLCASQPPSQSHSRQSLNFSGTHYLNEMHHQLK